MGLLNGGSGESIYAARCTLKLERRTLPHETEALVVRQVQQIVDDLRRADPTFEATVRPMLTRPAFSVDPAALIVTAVRDAAARVLGAVPDVVGKPFWMDASLIAQAGIETVVIGPIGAGAHGDEEWGDLASVQ